MYVSTEGSKACKHYLVWRFWINYFSAKMISATLSAVYFLLTHNEGTACEFQALRLQGFQGFPKKQSRPSALRLLNSSDCPGGKERLFFLFPLSKSRGPIHHLTRFTSCSQGSGAGGERIGGEAGGKAEEKVRERQILGLIRQAGAEGLFLQRHHFT